MILRCYFCNKEFIREWIPLPNGGGSLPMFFKCAEHYPEISFHREGSFILGYKGFTFVADSSKKLLEIVTHKDNKKSSILFPLPETKDLKEFTEYLDRILRLQAFT